MNDNEFTVRNQFINKFQNDDVRFNIGKVLLYGFYREGNLTRLEYAMKLMNNAKYLIPPPSEEVRAAFLICNRKSWEEFVEFLESLNQAGPLKYPKPYSLEKTRLMIKINIIRTRIIAEVIDITIIIVGIIECKIAEICMKMRILNPWKFWRSI